MSPIQYKAEHINANYECGSKYKTKFISTTGDYMALCEWWRDQLAKQPSQGALCSGACSPAGGSALHCHGGGTTRGSLPASGLVAKLWGPGRPLCDASEGLNPCGV